MRVRFVLLLLLAVVGCESMRPAAQNPPDAPLRVAAKPPENPTQVVEVLRASATQPPVAEPQAPVEVDSLTLATQCLERDDIRGATTHLDAYVRAHPDQPLFRLQLAELYLRTDKPANAKHHYEEFAKAAQDAPALQAHRVTAHIKLMEMAQRSGDKFNELFHRGVGLLLLVKQMDGMEDRDELFCEEMLCKSLRALTDAKELKPTDPRVRAYLAGAHARAGNRSAAKAEREAAKGTVTSGELTLTERKPLLE
jgi:predicted Zn-dependent protease